MLCPIPLKDLLQAPNRTREVEFRQQISDFEALTPVEGVVKVTHRGNFVEVSGEFSTIVTLDCCRCLNTYNHRICADVDEILWLEKNQPEPGQELELGMEDLVEALDPDGMFDVEDWTYQQLCLSLPQKQICSADCSGLTVKAGDDRPTDSRWDALKHFKLP
ncbi:MAG: DUF177 domain-containing protein [Synechococcus sp.]